MNTETFLAAVCDLLEQEDQDFLHTAMEGYARPRSRAVVQTAEGLAVAELNEGEIDDVVGTLSLFASITHRLLARKRFEVKDYIRDNRIITAVGGATLILLTKQGVIAPLVFQSVLPDRENEVRLGLKKKIVLDEDETHFVDTQAGAKFLQKVQAERQEIIRRTQIFLSEEDATFYDFG